MLTGLAVQVIARGSIATSAHGNILLAASAVRDLTVLDRIVVKVGSGEVGHLRI